MFQGVKGSASDTGEWRRVWRVLPWVGFAVVAVGVLVGYLGFIPGVWGQTLLLLVFMASVLALRHDLLSAVVLVGLGIVEDWYHLVPLPHDVFYTALGGAIVLTLVRFVAERREQPWRQIARIDLLFWGAFLLLGALAIPRGSDIPGNPKTIFFIALNYWVYIFLAAAAFWLLGALIVRRGVDLRRLCVLLAAFATLLAVHAIIQGLTGVTLFLTPYWKHYLAQSFINNYRLADGAVRASSFIMAPDTAEAFFSSVVFLPLGLLFASQTWAMRALYAVEVGLILYALLLTYGPVGWAAVVIGVVFFAIFGLHGRARQIFVGGLAVVVVASALVFAREFHTLFKHATGGSEITIRLGLFKTAMNVIRAHPLTGIGLGQGWVYQLRAQPYKDPSQRFVRADAQNSFQEFAAFAGIPVLLSLLLVLGRGLLQSLRNLLRMDATLRPVAVGMFLVVIGFCVNGLSDVTFTTPPMVPIIYLLLGALSSPWLARSLAERSATTADESVAPRALYPVRYGPPHAADPDATTARADG